MQIAPIRPYNMSQKQNQQNTNFKGVAFKLDKSSPALLKYIDSCKEPPAKLEVIKKEMLRAINDLQNVCNSFLPKILEFLLVQYEREGLIDEKIDYEKLVKDIWPNDTEVTVQLKDATKKTKVYNGPIVKREIQKFVGKSGDKEYTIVEMENEGVYDVKNGCVNIYGNIYHPIFSLEAVVSMANDHLWQDADCVEIIKNFTEDMLKEQPGYKELIKTLEEKKVFKYSPEATEARRKTWLDDKELGVDAKINRLLEALSPEEIEVLKKQLL